MVFAICARRKKNLGNFADISEAENFAEIRAVQPRDPLRKFLES
jgi:hypothetical protein